MCYSFRSNVAVGFAFVTLTTPSIVITIKHMFRHQVIWAEQVFLIFVPVAFISCWNAIKKISSHHLAIFLMFFLKNGPILAFFCLFSSFSHYNFNNTNWKSIDGVLGFRTRGRMMVGADDTTELWRPPIFLMFVYFESCFHRTTFNKGITKIMNGSPLTWIYKVLFDANHLALLILRDILVPTRLHSFSKT